jgi:competence protein ComEC
VVVAGSAGAVWRRARTAGALIALFASAAVAGHLTATADGRCARRIEGRGVATVRLREAVGGSRTARGTALEPGCRVRVRVRAPGTHAAAGSLVRVAGNADRKGDAVTFAAASVRLLSPPSMLSAWRSRAGQLIDALYGSHAPLARALLIADERDIASDVRRRYADAGIIHMLSVSGLHVAVLAEAVVLALLLCGARVRRAEGIALATIALFVVFVGAPAPAVRAAAMYGAMVAARAAQRPTSPWALLALGGLLPLADPRVVRDIGYQLSVVGMAGLLASGLLARRLALDRLPDWAARVARETLATVIASAVTAPIVAWHFGRVSLAAPLTNLAAAPLFGLAQPALFLSILAAPIRPLARFVADATTVLLAAIDRVAVVGAAIPGAALDALPSGPTALLVAIAAGALLVACTARYPARPLMAMAAAVSAAVWWPLVWQRHGPLEVHVLDVGQGDAVALRTPKSRWILIDAGDTWRDGDAGSRVVVPYLRRRGGPIAALILSHPHADHIGGAATLLRRLRVGAVLDGGFVAGSGVYAAVLTSARSRAVPWREVRAGDSLLVDGVVLRVLAPDARTVRAADGANEASVVILADYRGARVLLTGDAEAETEGWLRERYGASLAAHVLKVGHHGSATSSGARFLDAVRPRVALVSVGAGNRYGHPSPAVLRELAARGAQVLRTDHDGTIVVTVDRGTLRVATDEERWSLQIDRRPTRD